MVPSSPVTVVALGVAGCFGPDFAVEFDCSRTGICPSGLACVDGTCRSPGGGFDAGVETALEERFDLEPVADRFQAVLVGKDGGVTAEQLTAEILRSLTDVADRAVDAANIGAKNLLDKAGDALGGLFGSRVPSGGGGSRHQAAGASLHELGGIGGDARECLSQARDCNCTIQV